jgi:hypothetical protein
VLIPAVYRSTRDLLNTAHRILLAKNPAEFIREHLAAELVSSPTMLSRGGVIN